MTPLNDRVAIVTGAGHGIGHATALALAAAGADVAAVDIDKAAAEKTAAAVAGLGRKSLALATDVGDLASIDQMVSGVVQAFGRVDALVNNAGVSAHALFEDVAAEDLKWYQDLMTVNLWGAVWCTHAALPHLKATRGQIVAVSSLAGLVGVPGRTAYSATKFAMGGFFEALRAELKPAGVSVTLAYPGVVDTDIRRRGFNARGQAAGKSGLKEDDAMPVDLCARLILDGMEARQREVVMTARGKLGRWLKLVAPGLIENMALAALADHARPAASGQPAAKAES
jgi:NAD(P)-dependent dehydrogenase (short-subunit alcohol dehydrogenase family)